MAAKSIPVLLTVFSACLHISSATRVYGNYSGDILLAAFFPIHQRVRAPVSGVPGASRANVCGEIQEEDGVQAMEAFIYTLDKINRDPILLKGYQLGAVILDSCDDDTHALEQAVDLIRVLMTRDDISNLPFRCPGGTLPVIDPGAAEFHKVVGVTGGSSSSVSLQLASLLKLFQLPQVSYLSTSPDLSNQERYPFFKRTVPSDSYQAKAIIELLVEFKWTYVSLIYEDSNYGTKGFAELERAASLHGVCFAYTKRIDFNAAGWGEADYEAIIKGMSEKDRSNVAILWADFPRARSLFQAAQRLNKTDILWIGSDGWSGRNIPVSDLGKVVKNAVGVQPLARKLGGFDHHFTQLRPLKNKNNPWFREFWEKHFNCKFDSASKDIKKCTGKEELGPGYRQQLTLHFISDSAFAFAHALSAMHNRTCHGVPGLCDAMQPSNISGPELLQHLADVTFKSATEDDFQFVNGIDGPPRYSIMSYREMSTRGARMLWTEAGTYYGEAEADAKLMVDEAFRAVMSEYPPSSCSIPCGTQQAKTYVKGERCCWTCTNCSEWAIVIRLPTDDMNDECFTCLKGTQPNANHTWCDPIEPTYMDHSRPPAIVSMVVALIFLLFAMFAAVVFAVFYKTPVVKASGRELTFILIGVIMLSYLATFVFVSKPSPATCALTRILLGLCYTGVYASILAKASRISRIFNDGAGSPKKARLTSPKSQMLIMGVLMVVEVLVLAVWIATNVPRTTHVFPDRAVRLLVCSGSQDASYLIALVYPFLLMLACLVYAFKTRKTPDGFNETRLITFTSYTTVVIWIAFVPLYFINLLNNEVRMLTLCLSVTLNATVALLCLLYPKVYICLFRPEKNTREAVMTRTQSVLSSSSVPNVATGDRPPDSPSGGRRLSRRSSSVSTIPGWQNSSGNHSKNNGIANGGLVDNSFSTTPPGGSPSKSRPRTNSGTQTTFSMAYYAPVYDISEDHEKRPIMAEISGSGSSTGDSGIVADVDDVTLEFPDVSDIGGVGSGVRNLNIGGNIRPSARAQYNRRVSINAIKQLPDVQEDSSTT